MMCDPAPEIQRFSCACTVCHVGEPSSHVLNKLFPFMLVMPP
jgi:hypothetical protein